MKKIVIVTHAPQGTLGDPSSAAKLQQCILNEFSKQSELIDIKVVVQVKSQYAEPVKKLFQSNMPYQLLNEFDESTLIPEIIDADLIILYPTPHFFDYSSALLIGKTKKRVLAFGEYDIDLDYQHQYRSTFFSTVVGSVFLSTGVSEKSIGIYLNEHAPSRKNLWDLIHPEDSSKLPKDLRQGQGLYFGYFNKIADSCTGATPARFIAFAAHNSPYQKEIDIIMPLQTKDATHCSQESTMRALSESHFVENLRGFNQVLIAYFPPASGAPLYLIYHPGEGTHSEISKEEFENQQNGSDKIIRLFNPFPLQQQSMEAFLEISESVNLLTGDQSISEALSFTKIPFYQAMSWKKHFYESLIDVAKKGALTTLQRWFELVDDQFKSPKELADFYCIHQDMLRKETEVLREYLLKEKNLSLNSTAYIRSMLTLSTYELFKKFIDNLALNFNYYVSEQGEGKKAIVGSMSLFDHLNFYLEDASTHEKNSMIMYFIEHIDQIIDVKTESIIHLFSKLKRIHPEITLSLSYPLLLNMLCAEAMSHISTIEWNYDTSSIKFYSEKNALIDLKKNEIERVKKPMLDMNNIPIFLVLIGESQCTAKEKMSLVQSIMDNLICYVSNFSSDEINSLMKCIIHETNPDVLRQIFTFLFTTPCYQDATPSILFYSNKPSPYFQIPDNKRIDFLMKILAHPHINNILFKLDTLSMHYILDELLFSNTYERQNLFWVETSKWSNPSFIRQVLSVNSKEEQMVIQHYLESAFKANLYKKKIMMDNMDSLPTYLQEFMNSIDLVGSFSCSY
ncbi:hypothetical protein Lgra_1155 [Legionella gratiana]|uniref:Uncharacterized protein n=1 Tax=Legionella gratiana TaxID=45066 RepID=A0A378J1M8_9GAMM|nr:hypothetical protein [Legionella gratiana]KTD11697.1 hypothetical protein Lgra_1155 [Legionella gratiana]STX40827.1 Uncharacterised protein [Legionella gratiana]